MTRFLATAAWLTCAATPLFSQVPDARLIPPGALRVAFTPSWESWDRFFDGTGAERLLGSIVSSDSAGADLFPTLGPAEAAVRALADSPSYRLSLGGLRTALDADVRRFPFAFSVGVSRRLTLTATVPIVVTRMNAAVTLDSTTGNAGWNQNAPEAGGAGGPAGIAALLSQLDTRVAQLNLNIGAGQYGCPSSPSCAQAQDLASRAGAFRASVVALTATQNGAYAPAAPTSSSPAGQAIAATLVGLSQEFQTFGLAALTATLPLPARRLTAMDVQSILTSASFGYGAEPFQYRKISAFGDIELGVRFGLLQSAAARIVVHGLVRLPTGRRDSPDHFIDLAPADRQPDVSTGIEAFFTPGSVVSLGLAGSYTLQLADHLPRRPAPVDQPITTAGARTVSRDLGDYVSLGAYPGLRLNEAFTVYVSGTYFRKQADRYPDVPVLGERTAAETTSFGGGIQYRSLARGGARLPVEAGLSYSAAYTGSGGFAPKSTVLTMSLRFFYNLWGETSERGTSDE